MKHLAYLIFVICAITATAQDNSFADRINPMLDKHFDLMPSEAIFVQTDRDVYRAGDIVWFSAFVSNPSVVGLGSVSDNLVVALYDEKGEKINEDKYELVGGLCGGDFNLPKDSEPGRYVLVAYSGATVKENELFMKILYVDEFDRNGLIVKEHDNPLILRSGKENDLAFEVSDLEGQAFSGRLNYVLKYADDEIVAGKEKTDEIGVVRFQLELPEEKYDVPLDLVIMNGKQEVYKAPYHVDTEKVRLNFGVEGGHLLADVNQKVVFRIANSLGQQVSVEAELLEKSTGQQLLRVKTMAPGFGIFPLTAKAGETYQLRITEGPGKGQIFNLPETMQSGLSLALTRTDDQFIYCSLQPRNVETKILHCIAFCGNQLIWGADLNIDDMLTLKIPKEKFPEGVCQLLVLDDDLNQLAGRLIYVDQKGPVQVEVKLNPERVAVGESTEVAVSLVAESSAEQSGVLNLSICPDVMIADGSPDFEGSMKVNDWLKFPISNISQIVKEGKLNESSVNYLLIGNELKNRDWETVKKSQSMARIAEGIMRAGLEDLIPGAVDRFLQETAFNQKPNFTPEFYRANEDLFVKVRAQNSGAMKSDQYKQYLASGSSLLDVIKMIKPFTLDGDKIIFPGGTNSLLFQDGALIVIDGQRMGTSAGALNAISPLDVESIDISTRPIDIQQYTGLNSVGLIDIKTKKGERIVETNDEPVKQYASGNRIPRLFEEEIQGAPKGEKRATLFWEPFAVAAPAYQHEIPGTKMPARYLMRILVVDDAGRMGTKELEFDVK